MTLYITPISLRQCNEFIERLHRHHKAVQGHKFSIGVCDARGVLHGVVAVGRPVNRHRDDGVTAEVTRLCTDGTPNACSMLYGAAARAAFAMGYLRIGTYTLASESGASLRASGWIKKYETRGGSWSCESRPREDKAPLEPKILWERCVRSSGFDLL